MNKVLENQKVCFISLWYHALNCLQVFLLIDEGTIRKYKTELADEIEPQINELIEHAERDLKALSRKQALVQSKVCHNYQSGRTINLTLETGRSSPSHAVPGSDSTDRE